MTRKLTQEEKKEWERQELEMIKQEIKEHERI